MRNKTTNNRMRCVTRWCFRKVSQFVLVCKCKIITLFGFMAMHIINFRNRTRFFLQYWNGVCFLLHYLFGQVNHKLRSFFRDVKPWNALIDSKHWHKGEKQTNKHLKIDKLSSCEVAEQLSVINKYSWTFRSDVLFIQDA